MAIKKKILINVWLIIIQHEFITHLPSNSFTINSRAIKLIYYQLTCYQTHLLSTHLPSNSFTINSRAIKLIYYQLTCHQTHLLSTHVLSNSFTINSRAIKLIYYQLGCYQPQLLSKHLLSNAFTINLVAITFICYQALFAINSQLHSTFLVSVIIFYQIFGLLSNFIFTHFVPNNTQKNGKFLKNVEFFSGKLCMGMESTGFVSSSKETNLLKNGNITTSISTTKPAEFAKCKFKQAKKKKNFFPIKQTWRKWFNPMTTCLWVYIGTTLFFFSKMTKWRFILNVIFFLLYYYCYPWFIIKIDI